MKVEQFINKNQFVIWSDNNKKITFQSYNSTVCEITGDKITLGRDWDYSNTTRKHLYLFLNDYGTNTIRRALNNTNNKRKAVEKLIKEKVIKYNEKLR